MLRFQAFTKPCTLTFVERGAQDGHQLVLIKRLHQVPGGADLMPMPDVRRMLQTRDEDNGNIARFGMVFQPIAYFCGFRKF